MSKKILIADDDKNIATLVSLYLKKEGYEVAYAGDGAETLIKVKSFSPDLIILDIMMPEIDGYEVCRKIKTAQNIPIIMLSAKGSANEKVVGLDMGADDYISKPFDNLELVARVKAVLRRFENPNNTSISLKGLTIDSKNRRVIHKNYEIPMKPMEFDLLCFLALHPNQVFTREELLKEIWGYDFAGDTRTVDVHVTRIREKLKDSEGWEIKTVWKQGYKLEIHEISPAL